MSSPEDGLKLLAHIRQDFAAVDAEVGVGTTKDIRPTDESHPNYHVKSSPRLRTPLGASILHECHGDNHTEIIPNDSYAIAIP